MDSELGLCEARTQARHEHLLYASLKDRSGPALANKVELCDEPVGSSGADGLPSRVARRMVVETSLGATLGVAAIPHAHVHGIDGRFASSKHP